MDLRARGGRERRTTPALGGAAPVDGPSGGYPSAELVRRNLKQVLNSRQFLNSGRMSRFLRFVVEQTLEGHADELKESVLAVEVFDRQTTYDTRVDSLVRVQAGRLREKLHKYYLDEGRDAQIWIELPKGSYVPLFQNRDVTPIGPALVRPLAEKQPVAEAATPAPAAARPRYTVILAAVTVLIVLTAFVAWWWQRGHRGPPVHALVRLTSDTSLTFQPAISWNSKLLAYASDRAGEGGLDIWVQPLEGGPARRLTFGAADELEPDFSPDGRFIVYRSEQEGGGLYLIPTLGQGATLLVRDGYRPRFSPDAQHIAYWTGEKRIGIAGMFVIGVRGGNATPLAADFRYAAYPTWSPDGRKILFVGDKNGEGWDWWIVPAEGGSPFKTGLHARLRKQGLQGSDHRWGVVRVVPSCWTADQNVIFSAQSVDRSNLWRVELPETGRDAGPAQRMTSGSGREDYLSGGPNGRFVFSEVSEKTDVWRLQLQSGGLKAAGQPVQLTRGAANNIQPQVSNDGKTIVFLSNRNGNYDVVVRDIESGRETALTSTTQDESSGTISPDGSRVAFGMTEAGKQSIYSVPKTGGNTDILCEDCGYPRSWSPDGTHLLTQYATSNGPRIGLLSLPGKPHEVVGSPGAWLSSPQFSRDGEWIAVVSRHPPDAHRIMAVPFRNGHIPHASKWSVMVGDGHWVDKPRWSPNGDVLYFVSNRDGSVCIWAQPLRGADKTPMGEPVAIWHFHGRHYSMDNEGALNLTVAQDSLIFSLQESTGNVWMLTEDRTGSR